MVPLPAILDQFPTATGLEEVRTPVEAMEALDVGHLVLVTPDPGARERFLNALEVRLDLNHRAVVLRVRPEGVIGPVDPGAADPAELLSTLGEHLDDVAGTAKLQYILWEDADRFLPQHAHALRRTLDARFAAAAELEFTGPDTLIIQRHLLLGGPVLEEFALGLLPGLPPLGQWLPGTITPAAADAGMPSAPDVAILPLRA
jgi:hypothetical protein